MKNNNTTKSVLSYNDLKKQILKTLKFRKKTPKEIFELPEYKIGYIGLLNKLFEKVVNGIIYKQINSVNAELYIKLIRKKNNIVKKKFEIQMKKIKKNLGKNYDNYINEINKIANIIFNNENEKKILNVYEKKLLIRNKGLRPLINEKADDILKLTITILKNNSLKKTNGYINLGKILLKEISEVTKNDSIKAELNNSFEQLKDFVNNGLLKELKK